MTFLKKLGTIVVQVAGFLSGVGPLFAKVNPQSASVVATVTSDVTQFANLIATVEAIGQSLGLSGADKLKAAIPLFSQALLQSEFMVGKKIANPTLFTQASSEFAQASVDFLNSLSGDSVVAGAVPTA